MGHIVVGVDESSSAAAALRWAVSEGRQRGWPVTAVLAWEYLGQHHGNDSGDVFDPQYGVKEAAAALDRLVERAVPTENEIERRVVLDLPAPALLDASKDANLLVVGARGYGGFRGLLLGSVSQKCAHQTTVPIAIIRSPVETTPSTSGRIVVGIDGSENSLRALDWAVDEARARHAPLTVVHAWQPVMFAGIDYAAPMLDPAPLKDAATETVERALAHTDTSGLTHPVETSIVQGGAAQAVLDACPDASLIVVGSRGRGGFSSLLLGSVSQQVISHTTCPVVVVPPADRT